MIKFNKYIHTLECLRIMGGNLIKREIRKWHHQYTNIATLQIQNLNTFKIGIHR